MTQKRVRQVLLLCLCCAFGAASARAQEKKLKLFISVDMEGIVGVVTSDQLHPGGFEYERAREWMTAETNAAIEAARASGAGEIVVADSHGNGENLLLDRFPKDVTLVRSWPRPLSMMQGIDATFDGVIFLGYHASTANPQGVRAHTISSARFADLRLNGRSVSEAALSAAIAGQFGVPVIMISGDDAAVKEATEQLGNLEGAVVKWSLSYHSARTLTPDAACDLVREKVKQAIARIRDFKPYRVQAPVTLDLRFKNYRPSEVLAYLPGVERTDSHSIRFVGKDIVEVSRFIAFITEYDFNAEP